MTLEQEFESFMEIAFKGERITALQYKICERLFYAGCLVMMDKFLSLPSDQGDARAIFSSLIKQLEDIREKI